MTNVLFTRRLYWNRGIVGDGNGHSNKLSIKLLWDPRDLWLGVYWTKPSAYALAVYVCLLPCLPIRIHHLRAYGGIFPGAMRSTA